MPDIQFDITGARKDGVSNQELSSYFKNKFNVDFDFESASKDGVSDSEIMGFLNSKMPKEPKQEKQTSKDMPTWFSERDMLGSLTKKGKDEWEGSAGVVKPTPMESMELEAKKKKPSDGTTGVVKPIIRNLKEEEKAFDNVTQRRLKAKGITFKQGDANYKKERDAVLKDVYDGTLVATENNKGEKDYGRSIGFLKSTIDETVGGLRAEIDAAKINTMSDPTEFSVYMENEASKAPEVQDVKNKYGVMLGGIPKMLAITAAGEAATGGFGGGPAALGADALWVGTSVKRQELYWEKKKELVDKGMDAGEAGVQAAQAAMQDAPLAAVPDAAIQYAMASMSGGESPELTASRNAFKNYVAKPTKIAVMGASQPIVEYGIKKAQGYDVDFQDAIANSGKGFTDYYLQDLAFNVGMHPLKFAKTMVSSAKEYLSNLPKEILESTASKYGAEGKQVIENLKSYNNARQKVADYVPQDIVHHVAGLQEAIDNGTAKLSAMKAPDANIPEAIIKTEEQRIAEIKNRQNKIIETGQGDVHEIDDKTGLPIETKEPYTQTEDGKTADQKAKDMGFDNVTHAINSVNKELGTDYKTIQEIPEEDLQKVSDNKKELTAHQEALSETVNGTEYEDKARSAGLRTDTTTGATGEVSAEPTGKAEPIEGATPTEQSTFDEYTKSRRADPERFKREYESERYADFGETEEEYLRRKFCK